MVVVRAAWCGPGPAGRVVPTPLTDPAARQAILRPERLPPEALE